MPHRVNEVEITRKLKACFSEKCFSLTGYNWLLMSPSPHQQTRWLALQQPGLIGFLPGNKQGPAFLMGDKERPHPGFPALRVRPQPPLLVLR